MLTMFKLQVVCFVTLLGFAAADYDPLHTYTPKTKVTDHVSSEKRCYQNDIAFCSFRLTALSPVILAAF